MTRDYAYISGRLCFSIPETVTRAVHALFINRNRGTFTGKERKTDSTRIRVKPRQRIQSNERLGYCYAAVGWHRRDLACYTRSSSSSSFFFSARTPRIFWQFFRREFRVGIDTGDQTLFWRRDPCGKTRYGPASVGAVVSDNDNSRTGAYFQPACLSH